MSQLVPAEEIEGIVGVTRHATQHWGRAVSAEQTVYILHSQECLDDPEWGLQDCPYSRALDQGIDTADWDLDEPVPVIIRNGSHQDWLVGKKNTP